MVLSLLVGMVDKSTLYYLRPLRSNSLVYLYIPNPSHGEMDRHCMVSGNYDRVRTGEELNLGSWLSHM